ncbi:MAG: hypothetical protein QHC67_01255 [Sphingobium sp.]|nr:hypothetical protein [Sphingobium sp.]MDX3908435.1 hypothetical protein [Sphingobium sp.]
MKKVVFGAMLAFKIGGIAMLVNIFMAAQSTPVGSPARTELASAELRSPD